MGKLVGVSEPEVVALRQWGRHKGYYEVAWREARVLHHRQDGPPPVSWGFAARCGYQHVLLYRRPSDDRLILQVGPAAFDLQARTPRTGYRSLLIASRLSLDDGVNRRVINNLTLSRLFALLDPSYDSLDEEGDDFLLYLHQQLGLTDWADAVRHRWGTAEPGGQ